MRPKTNRPLLVAITGDIGSGKSTVLNFFKEKKYSIWSADEAVRELYTEQQIMIDIQRLFDQNILINGKIDMDIMRKIVFSDINNLQKLENYLHPKIIEKLRLFVNFCLTQCIDDVVIFEIPLLFECKLDKYFDINILITADLNTKILRIGQRDKRKVSDILDILNRQLPQEKKEKKANIIIENNDTVYELKSKLVILEKTFKYMKKKAAPPM